jgi:hypothetical protein
MRRSITMRMLLAGLLACGSLLGGAGGAAAQEGGPPARQQVRIRDVRVGFPAGNTDFYKAGYWTPVLVDLEVVGGDFRGTLVVETKDSDGVGTRYHEGSQPITLAQQERQRTVLTYTKIGSTYADVDVTIQGRVESRTERTTVSYTFRYPEQRHTPIAANQGMFPQSKLILAIGAQPAGFEPALQAETEGRAGYDHTWQLTQLSDVSRLPRQWFGYEGVDVVILPTGNTGPGSAVPALVNDPDRARALAQWVEMGGHLVVSVAANHHIVANPKSFPPALERLLPARIDPLGTTRVEALEGLKRHVEDKGQARGDAAVRAFAADVAILTPRHTARLVVSEHGPPTIPLIVQGTCGLGRVTLIGFDTDRGPFTEWGYRRPFWTALLDLRAPGSGRSGGGPVTPFIGFESTDSDLAARLANRLENFGEVPVIPFALVALFIFLYILVIGPLDYLFLKKVVKGLEWTWLTFPALVLTISVGAYFLAHHLKGRELRINKVDLIDIDLRYDANRKPQATAYGTTWFTIFSPRMQYYTLSVEPTGPVGTPEGLVVSWMGRPGHGARSFERSQTPGLFRRSYDYADEAKGLRGVPIQVWSMKTLTARWQAPLAGNRWPFRYELTMKRRDELDGTITSDLPRPLDDCWLVFQRTVYSLGTLEPGVPTAVPAEYQRLERSRFGRAGETLVVTSEGRQVPAVELDEPVYRMMFQRANPSSGERNDYLAYVDQSWRMEFDEAILVGRLRTENGAADAVNAANVLGTRLKPFEPDLTGTMRQVIIVRAFLPVLTREPK